MTVLNVRRRIAPVEQRNRRIDTTAKFFAVDAVSKVRAISDGALVRLQLVELRQHFTRNNIIRIECKYPGRRNAGLFESKLPLVPMIVEDSLNYAHIRKRLRNRNRLIFA